jgi:hypothetical protein
LEASGLCNDQAYKSLQLDVQRGSGTNVIGTSPIVQCSEEAPAMLTLSSRYLQMETAAHRGTGGVSAENRQLGFRPAFQDTHTGQTYLSTFADGQPAPFHLLEGLPERLVLARDRHGRVSRVEGSIVAGFLREGVFYTRAQAAALVCEETAETA